MKSLNKYGWISFTSPLRWIAAAGLFYFLGAGRINIGFVWGYIAIYSAGGIMGGLYVVRRNPHIFNERGRIKGGSDRRDVCLMLAYFLCALIFIPVIAGLDIRNGWSILPPYIFYIGIILYIISLYFSFGPLVINPFFETNIRIQSERSHYVVDTGLNAIIRHPGYFGMITGVLALCCALRSLLAFTTGLVAFVLIVIRTHLEDRVLKGKLPGYSEYSKRVRYKLIPLIW